MACGGCRSVCEASPAQTIRVKGLYARGVSRIMIRELARIRNGNDHHGRQVNAMIHNYWSQKHVADRLTWAAEEHGISRDHIRSLHEPDMPTVRFKAFRTNTAWFPMLRLRIGGAQRRGWRLEYGCPLRRVRCQANGLAYASTMGSIAGVTATTECPPKRRGSEWKHESPRLLVEERIKRIFAGFICLKPPTRFASDRSAWSFNSRCCCSHYRRCR